MESLCNYLATVPAASEPPSPWLLEKINSLAHVISEEPLSDEATTITLFANIFRVVKSAVQEVDQNTSLPEIKNQMRQFSQIPDLLIRPHDTAGPTLHWENKSSKVFDAHAPRILSMGQQIQEGGCRGSYLRFSQRETDHRSILFKVSTYNYYLLFRKLRYNPDWYLDARR
jgi:hypothetical protein